MRWRPRSRRRAPLGLYVLDASERELGARGLVRQQRLAADVRTGDSGALHLIDVNYSCR